jgi:hypothetical protein
LWERVRVRGNYQLKMKHSCYRVSTKENENQKEAVAGLQAGFTGLLDRAEVEAEA